MVYKWPTLSINACKLKKGEEGNSTLTCTDKNWSGSININLYFRTKNRTGNKERMFHEDGVNPQDNKFPGVYKPSIRIFKSMKQDHGKLDKTTITDI